MDVDYWRSSRGPVTSDPPGAICVGEGSDSYRGPFMSDNGDFRSPRQAWERAAAIREAAELDVRRIEAMDRRLRDWRAHAITATANPATSTEEGASVEK